MSPIAETQQRNVKIVLGVIGAGMAGLIIAGALLYKGLELPPHDLRQYYASATGYAPPLKETVLPPGTFPRGSGSPILSPPGAAAALVPGSVENLRLTALGEKAYRTNCAMCHGSPGGVVGPVGRLYTPRPPDLSGRVRTLSDAQLADRIGNGIRSTPTPETRQYLPKEWHAFNDLLPYDEQQAVIAYLRTTAKQ